MKNTTGNEPKGPKKGRLAKALLGGGAVLLAGHQMVSESRDNTSLTDFIAAPVAERVHKLVKGGGKTPLNTIVQEGNALIPPVVVEGKQQTPGLYELTDGTLTVHIAGGRSATKFTFDIERFPLGQKQDIVVDLEVIQTLSARQIAKLQDSFQRVFIDTPGGQREIDDIPTHPGSLPAYFIAAIMAARMLRRKRGAPGQEERNAEWDALSKIVGYCGSIAQMLEALPEETGLRDEYTRIRQIPSLRNFLDNGVVPSPKEYPLYHGSLFQLWQRVTAAWEKVQPQESATADPFIVVDGLGERVIQGETFLEAIQKFFSEHKAEEFADQREFHAIRTGFRDLDQSGRTAWITGSPIEEPAAEEEQAVIALLQGYDKRINDLKPAAPQLSAAPSERPERKWNPDDHAGNSTQALGMLNTARDALNVSWLTEEQKKPIRTGLEKMGALDEEGASKPLMIWINQGPPQGTNGNPNPLNPGLTREAAKRAFDWLATIEDFIEENRPKQESDA